MPFANWSINNFQNSDSPLLRFYAEVLGVNEIILEYPQALLKPKNKDALLKPFTLDETLPNEFEALKKHLLASKLCPFQEMATQIVFGDGNPQSDLLILGEAPGYEEDKIGKPFVGPSGKLLEKMLSFIGITRENCYISNVIFWRPPQNRQPTPEDVSLTMPYIRKMIDIMNPKFILTLGTVPTKALLETTKGITQLRGKFFPYGPNPSTQVLPSFHPANLLRSPQNKALSWKDLLLLKQKIKH